MFETRYRKKSLIESFSLSLSHKCTLNAGAFRTFILDLYHRSSRCDINVLYARRGHAIAETFYRRGTYSNMKKGCRENAIHHVTLPPRSLLRLRWEYTPGENTLPQGERVRVFNSEKKNGE